MTTSKPNRAARSLSKRGASKGGKARANVLTSEERTLIARKAVRTRWAREKGLPVPTDDELLEELMSESSEPEEQNVPVEPSAEYPVSRWPGTLTFGEMTMPVHVLSDGHRVFAQREVVRALTGIEKGNLQRYIGAHAIAQFIDAGQVAEKTVEFLVPGAGRQMRGIGYEATLLVEICDAYLKARDQGLLTKQQLHIAKQAEVIMRSCAKVGIIALVDEATGYQEVREKNALQLKLQAFIADEMQEWAKLFPDDFWHELARLEHTRYSPRSRPLRWGKYVMAFVYDAVDKDVGKELRRINPNPHYGKNHHQWLKTYGRGVIRDHINQVIGVMKTCRDMTEFNRRFSHVFEKTPEQLSFYDLLDNLN